MTTNSNANRDFRREQILAAQVRLLFGNRNVGVAVTLIATAVLSRVQWDAASHPLVLLWAFYMCAVAVARFVLGWCYSHNSPSPPEAVHWGAAFTIGAGLAGIGWGAAGIVLYPEAQLAGQVFLVFILGGMMLGAASLLAPWPGAFIAFLTPAGLAPSGRLLLQGILHGDERHIAMGAMAVLFTVATLITTARNHATILSSLGLQFQNQDLVADLRTAKSEAEALNQHLEVRVQERTAELSLSAEQLRTEIEQREQIEEELLRARKLESLGLLAGGIAHDFNNFLTVFEGNVELARTMLDPTHPVQTILNRTVGACQRAAFLASQLLIFAKGGVPVRRLVSVGKLVRDAVQLSRAGAQTTFDVNIASDLRCAEVDPGQMVQALHSILLNARQAMPEGGIVEVKAVNVTVPDEGSSAARIRIAIRDYGCGIPIEIVPRIFDPYFTTKTGASGLGLATAYAIIAKHGGSISVESKVGDGALFTIELPASLRRLAPEVPIASGTQGGGERLLIMDDEEALRQLLENVLTNLGYEVHTARDGAEAIAIFEEAKANGISFDAVLLDLTVSGGMGGEEAAARLKELDPTLKLIVSSGYSSAPVMSDFRKYGFDDVIPKPWSVAEVSQIFRRVLVTNPNRRSDR